MNLKIALAGNPNVGKSTVFNALTGLRQHTGNWAGKTVTCAEGTFRYGGGEITVIDLPGTYSLLSVSREEEVSYDCILYGDTDAVVIVCDAGSLCRNMNLTLQILEITPRVLLCVNLCDEAKKHGVTVDTEKLEKILGIPVVAASARNGEGIAELKSRLADAPTVRECFTVRYPLPIENAVNRLEMAVGNALDGRINERFASLRLLERGEDFSDEVFSRTGIDLLSCSAVASALRDAEHVLKEGGVSFSDLSGILVRSLFDHAEAVCDRVVTNRGGYDKRQLFADRLFTRRLTAIPIILLLLFVVFAVTISGANVVSACLASALNRVGVLLSRGLNAIHTPSVLHDVLIFGVYRVLSWVVAVMLPPMAIFFPLFTILEDAGLLPRIAFTMDSVFEKCRSCGKQALTMAMGFGCNAVGVTGCRIIDSPRERLIAMLTNAFVPCNGRFPLLITMISAFFVDASPYSPLLSALILTAFIALGVAFTFLVSYLLSVTVLRGKASSPVLELPPFRMPQFGRVLIRSVLDRTLFVLGRAVTVAAPAGLVLWLLANIRIGSGSILAGMTALLDPVGRFFGMDGVILAGFFLGLPANEIALPIMVMAYTSSGILSEYESIAALKALLLSHGWTAVTALCVMVFTIMHSPCATTLMTIKKESGSLKWTIVSAILPTAFGAGLCLLIRALFA